MDGIALDTSFLIDLQNEKRGRGRARGARAFLEKNRKAVFFLPVVARGEYLEGFEDPGTPEALGFIDAIQPLAVTVVVASTYARVVRGLRKDGLLIGANDLWIGCTALSAGLPIVTRNVADFRRIPGLGVLEYEGD